MAREKGEETAIEKVVSVSPQEEQVGSFIQQAITANVPVETMERLFVMHKEVKAEAARSEFVGAMAAFQASVPVIEKNRKVMDGKTGKVRYTFAPLGDIVAAIKDALKENGLSYSWTVEQTPGKVKAVARATHKAGHFEESTFEIDIDAGGYMTGPQKIASALTFAKRYSLCNVLGISTADEDVDATDVKNEPKVLSPKARIVNALKALGYASLDREQVIATVKKLTQLDATLDQNLEEIGSRLEVLVTEKQEHENN